MTWGGFLQASVTTRPTWGGVPKGAHGGGSPPLKLLKRHTTIGTKARFGGAVASVIWSEQPAIEITTRIHGFGIGIMWCMRSIFSVKSDFLRAVAASRLCQWVAGVSARSLLIFRG